ncbi:MAG TPA: choice-of-anchor D domain-containing protein, partial [Candidatus Kapabacteria bacterium]|nr:choice-of-anchor D domain-containing protein [Candidatus Kapabacteria bacterium]
LTLGKNWSLGDPADFSFSDATQLPVTIPPGGSTTLNFCFHPQATGPFETLQNWATDLPTPYAHQIKDTSQLLGFGVQGGLNWDRPKQGYWTECSNPVIDTVNLINPSTGGVGEDINVDSIKVIGADADEFTIVGYQTGFPPPFRLPKDVSKGVYLQFTPKLAKGYILRSAQLVAYGASGGKTFTPTIDLSGTVRHATIRVTPSFYDFGTVQPGTDVTTNLWIHNDGDTALSLTSLTIGGGFTISGYTQGEQVQPGDSVMVTIDNNNVPLDTTFATLAAGDDFKLCTSPDSSIIRVASSSFEVAAVGHDFGNVYVCQNGSAVLEGKDLGSKEAVLLHVQIFDTLGSQGASQFTFGNGSQSIDTEVGIHTGESVSIAVNYQPKIGGAPSTWIAYTFNDLVTGKDTIVYQQLFGTPLHYVNTLSVQNGTPTAIYSAYPGQSVTVPIRMLSNTLNTNAGIYSIQFVLRYERDLFIASPVVADNGLQLVSSNTVADPADPNYVLTTVTVHSNSPITQIDTIAHLQLEYVLSKDSVSTLQVMNPVYLDQSGNAACWVAHDTVPSAFAGLDRCGDPTLQTLLKGGTVSFHIQQITPNPVSNQANVTFTVHLDGVPLTMEVYNILGQREFTAMTGQPVPAGNQTESFQTALLPAGQYVLRATDGTTVQSVPFVVEK